jgi:hypothetical protein
LRDGISTQRRRLGDPVWWGKKQGPERDGEADEGVGRGPGGPPHQSARPITPVFPIFEILFLRRRRDAEISAEKGKRKRGEAGGFTGD